MRIPLSVLDWAPVPEGTPAAECLRRSIELAQLAEDLGYTRYWFAEHHGLRAVASSVPEILIAHTASATRRIRVGSGGVMLPNHAPLRVVEAFRMLEALYPGRIDLGIGRAPGSNVEAGRALRAASGEQFSALMSELLSFAGERFPRGHPYHEVCAMPEGVDLPPVWILGSSGASAGAAGRIGMGYSFATHFTLESPVAAMRTYRAMFQPSPQFPKPHAILTFAVVCAETEEEAERQAATGDLMRLRINRNEFPPLPSPEDALAYPYDADEHELVRQNRPLTVIGTPDKVRAQIEEKVAETAADEVMLVSSIYDHASRLDTYRLLAKAFADDEDVEAATG